MQYIRKANQQPAVKRVGGYRRFIEVECHARWNHKVDWTVNEKAPPLVAFIIESNWVWQCECNEQVVADPTHPLAFCPNCLNALWKFKARRVLFPKPETFQAVEILLLARPFPQNRNWRADHGETVDELIAENIAHHLPDKTKKE